MYPIKDAAHAAMMERFIQYRQRTGDKDGVEPEFPFDWYGHRGYVDVVSYWEKEGGSFLDLYELKVTIEDVGETLRQFQRQGEYFVQFFNRERATTPILCWGNYLVLLSSSENVTVVKQHIGTFDRVFAEKSKPLALTFHNLAKVRDSGEFPMLGFRYLLMFDPLNYSEEPTCISFDLGRDRIVRRLQSCEVYRNRKDFLERLRGTGRPTNPN